MFVTVQSSHRLNSFALPDEVRGAHWVQDAEGLRIAYIEGNDGQWCLSAHEGFSISGANGDAWPTVNFGPHRHAVVNLKDKAGDAWFLAFYPGNASGFPVRTFGFRGDVEMTVGRAASSSICYENSFVSSHHAVLSCTSGVWSVRDVGSSNGVFVNGERISKKEVVSLSWGDVVSILALRIVVGRGLFSINNPDHAVTLNCDQLVEYQSLQAEPRADVDLPNREYFYPALRFARSLERKSFQIDAPPQPEKADDTPLATRLGPSLIMALASVLSALTFVSMMADQGTSMMRAVPMVGMAVAMLCGSVLWPIINDKSKNKKRLKNETARCAAYSQYLANVRSDLQSEIEHQREILRANRLSVEECLDLAQRKDSHLMDRTPLHKDYLELRLGVGDEPFQADVRFPDTHFDMVEDDLRDAVDALAREPRVLDHVPVAFSLVEKPVVGIVGEPELTQSFVRGLVVQIAALCSYENVKIVVLCDDRKRSAWSFAAHIPHCFNDDKTLRYFAVDQEEANEVGMHLERVLEERRSADHFDARDAAPYYVIICDSQRMIDKSDLVQSVVKDRDNKGVSLIALAGEMKDLPRECMSVINVESLEGYVLERDDPAGDRKFFKPDIFVDEARANEFAVDLSSVRLDLAIEKQKIPSRLGFLEMHNMGSIEHVNIPSRWRESNASATLACRVGLDAMGEPFILNLHEKFHGPHGLIAGTTGSGKSEFIITYILSMAMTYSPNDVAFVLIDYKGGGLAKAFDNEHVRLPHLAGVITNLDGAAITRSLVSIKSELKRRQALFNRARDVVGGDNVDIYGYLDLFRQGKMTDPCPHLFIVADEFAELKQQEPEFMSELISAARIGRSLGVHLILATQKPSGVVNDQIWSNARFKVCLKVADGADSTEMIRRPDAAELTQAGRFYLLVGYNEYFALGQSGYAGTRYVPRERFAATKDESVVLVSDTGLPLVTVKPRQAGAGEEQKPESVVLLRAIQDAAADLGVCAHQLWLEPIPAVISVDVLREKYRAQWSARRNPWDLDLVVGEFDDPSNQRQGLFTLPLSTNGNALLYGTPDSGVEVALYALLYSLISSYTANQVNVYALDFGSESLKAFGDAPQVGDVICASDEEKVRRFFDFMEAEIARRRKLFSPYGGSYARYAREHTDESNILVIVNDVAAFLEAYPKEEDRLAKLIHESGHGGVHMVMTAAGSSSVRVRMRQGFRQAAAVNLADESDYSMIFGSMRGIAVPKGVGRGLVKTDEGIFEFQAAYIKDGADEFGAARDASVQAAARAETSGVSPARPVPTAPSVVLPEEIARCSATKDFIPYGVRDFDLRIAGFDFSDSPLARVQFQRKKDGAAFVRAFVEAQKDRKGWEIALIDLLQTLGEEKPAGASFATRKEDFAKSYLKDLMRAGSRASDQPQLLVVMSGIADFMNRNGRNFETGEDFAGDFKAFLRQLRSGQGIRFLLFDATTDTSYVYEDWYKAHLTNKDGLWVGPGADGQSAINMAYNVKYAPDSYMRKAKGYAVEGGEAELIHLVSIGNDTEQE